MDRPIHSAQDRQQQIIELAVALIAERGYTKTSVQAIIDAAGIAKGTFYHHFKSKEALLDAIVAAMFEDMAEFAEPLLADDSRGAIDKLCHFYLSIGNWKRERAGFMLALSKVMHQDANALLQKRTLRRSMDTFAPLVGRIIQEGVDEGVFNTQFPLHSAQIIMQSSVVLGESLQDAMVSGSVSESDFEGMFDAQEAMVERVIGAPDGSITLADRSQIPYWVAAIAARP